ncbi:MAG: GGDEF domain-containing protein [Acidobacteria bacterium]|nr:GGDEF domain-containing protein [Acidobacteriota bacterium]
MHNAHEVFEKLGPNARLQLQLSQLESPNRGAWILIVFSAAVLALGALSLLSPASFWRANELEIKIPPQVLFVIMLALVVVALDVTRREREVQRLRLANLQQTLEAPRLRAAGFLDTLTKVFNRNFLHEVLQGEIARAERNNHPLALLMCDINNFKQFNDRHGHLMGDFVLAQVAGIIKSCVRGSDYVVRYGGDEFLVILPETGADGAAIVRGRIKRKVLEWNQQNRAGEAPVILSLGLYHHIAGDPPEKDLAEADRRMYEDKLAADRTAAGAGIPLRNA